MEEAIITVIDDDGQEERFAVMEETRIGGISYLLVAEPDEADKDDATVYIIKDISDPDDPEAVYEFVYDDKEAEAVADVFAELLDDDTQLQI